MKQSESAKTSQTEHDMYTSRTVCGAANPDWGQQRVVLNQSAPHGVNAALMAF